MSLMQTARMSGGGFMASDFKFDIFQCSENAQHRWRYYPQMTRDEVLVFKTFDSHHPGQETFIPTMHTAIDDPKCPDDASPRGNTAIPPQLCGSRGRH